MADKLKKIAEKWEDMKKSKVNSNPIDITKFIPNIDDMIKEDCVVEYLQDIAKSIKNVTKSDDDDEYKDTAYYLEKPFTTTPGYYKDKQAFVLDVSSIKNDEAEWELNSTDGDTYSFPLSGLDIGGSFTLGGSEYSNFTDYVKKMNLVETEEEKRDCITLRTIGIDTAEIPHYDFAIINNSSTDIKYFTLNEADKESTGKNINFNYMPYDINKKEKKISKWTVTERNKDTKIPFYKVVEDGKTTYFEIIESINPYKYISKNDVHGKEIKTIVGNGKLWSKENVVDGFLAQQRVKEIIKNDNIQDMKLVLDASTTTAVKLKSDYVPYSSLWYIPETISYFINSWNDNSSVPLNRLTYSPFGTDKYGRFLGTLYAKIKTSDGNQWINVSKYVLAGTKKTIPNPDFNSSPELQQIKNGVNDEVFKLSTYNRNSLKYVDELEASGIQSYEDMVELQKELTGIDIKEKNECMLMIGDCLFIIPPESIRNISHLDYTKIPILRGKGSMVKNRTNREQLLEIDLFFYGEHGINGISYTNSFPNGSKEVYYMNGLRALFSQFRICPFLPITNYYINKILGIEVVSMVNIMVSTVPQFPKLLKATLTLRDFNYRIYMPDLPSPLLDETTGRIRSFEPVFGKCFEWELFRYYYQRCIIHGEFIKSYEYNSYKYGEYLYSYKNVLQRAKLDNQNIEFYIPDKEWLDGALKVKKDKDRYGQMIKDIKLKDETEKLLKDISGMYKKIDTLNFGDLDTLLKDSVFDYNKADTKNILSDPYWNINIKSDKKDFSNKFKKELEKYCESINSSYYVSGTTIDESCKDTTITYKFNIEINFGSITSEELENIREKIRDLDGGENTKDYFKDNKLSFNLKLNFNQNKKYDNYSIEKSKELIALNSSYNSNDDESKKSRENIQEQNFNYANYQDPKAMKFVPYLQDKDGNSIPIELDELSISTSNTFTEMYLKAQDGFAPQFMGGADVNIEFKIMTRDEMVIACLNQLPAYISQTTKTYRRILPCCPLRVRNDYLLMFGVNEVLIDDITIDTVDGYPGLYELKVKMTSMDRTMRQREAMRKLNTDGFSTNIAKAQIKSYFDLNTALGQAELYPDLDLPTLPELRDRGWEYLKYKNENRIYVDPDFYIVYSFKYTALLIKQIVKEYMFKKFYDTSDKTKSKENYDLCLQDSSGIKMAAMLNSVVGLDCINDNELADLYDDTIEQVSTQAEADDFNKIKSNFESLEDLMKAGASLECLTAYGIENGWQIKAKWYASIAETYINDLIEKLKESGIKRANTKKEDKDNEWVKDLYNVRKEAIKAIDNILSKPIEFTGTDNEPFAEDTIQYAISEIFDAEDGKKLLDLLDPMKNYKSGDSIKDFHHLNYHTKKKTIHLHGEETPISTDPEEAKKYYNDNPNILTYIEGYMFACACTLSGKSPFAKDANINNWQPRQFYNKEKGIPNVRIKDKEATNNQMENAKSMDEALEKGRFFGAFQIGIYTVNQITDMLSLKSKVDYGQKDMYEKSVKNHKRFCEEGFIDPYYNYAGFRSEKGKEYTKAIATSARNNAKAFLRIVLMYLKKMIIDGYFFSEIDIICMDFDYMKKQWSEYLENEEQEEWAQVGDDDHGGDGRELIKKYKSQTIAEQFGVPQEELTQLIEKDIPETYSKIFCARLIYPFLLAMSENNKTVSKLIDDRDYDTLNTMTLGTNIGYADYSPLDKFLKALYSIQMIGYNDDLDSAATTSNSQKIFNIMMQEITEEYSNNPKKYVLHSFYDMIKNDKRGRLIRAFPTFYIVFVDEGRKIGTWKLYDNFYNMSSINNIQIVKSRKNPTDVCSFQMSNIYTSYASTYDNSVYQQYVNVYGVKDVFDSIFCPKTYLSKEDMIRGRKELMDTVILQAGTRIHVRMGYGSNASNIPIVFNGKIAEVECGDFVQVVAQGDGHELCNPLNALGEFEAKSLEEAQDYITILKDIRGTLARGGESPKNLLAKLMTAKYGGLIKSIIRDTFDQRFFGDNPFGIYHFGDRRFKDIFEDSEIVQNMYEVSDVTLLSGYTTLIPDKVETCATPTINCSIQDKTMWEIGHMCANSGDDFYFAVRDFGMRSTLCLMKGNHYYAYEYAFENDDYFEKRKPFQQYHYYDSYNDIVYNTIKATEKNLKTNAIGTWQATDYVWGTSQATVGPIYLDMNIYPEYQKSMTVDTGLIASGNGGLKLNFATALSERWNYDAEDDKVNKSLAEKITTNVLRQNVKDMYDGELCIIGDPSVKPYDRFDIVDTYEDMSGSMEVETVIFSMNSDTGFTTTIVPDIIAKAIDCSQEVSTQTILANFSMIASTAVTSRLAMQQIAEKTAIDLVGKIVGSELVSPLATLLQANPLVSSLLAPSSELMTTLAINPVTVFYTAVAVAGIYIFTRNTKEMFYRWMKNIQAITVYPIQKNQRLLIAGMAGHRGSVYGYQYNDPKDSIQGAVMSLIDEGKKNPLSHILMEVFFSGAEYDQLYNYWKESLGINKADSDIISPSEYNLVTENLLQDIYSSASKEFSSRAANIQSLKVKKRITSFDTKGKTTKEYLKYQIGGIYAEAKKDSSTYASLADEDKKYVNAKDLEKNPKIQDLVPVEDDSEIKLAVSEGHEVIDKFKLSHSLSTTSFTCNFESGPREILYFIDTDKGDAIFDIPLIQQDALTLLKVIINQDELKDAIVYFLSGTRVNDPASWKSTGFAFTIGCDDKKALLEAVKKARKDTTWYGSDEDNKKHIFAYKEYDEGIMITVYAPTGD